MRFSLCIICPLACSVEKTYTVGYLLRNFIPLRFLTQATICHFYECVAPREIQLQPHIKEAYRVLYNKSTKNELCVLDIPFIKLRSDSRCYYRDITSRCNSFDAIMKRVVHIGQKNHVCITLNNDKVDQMKQSH